MATRITGGSVTVTGGVNAGTPPQPTADVFFSFASGTTDLVNPSRTIGGSGYTFNDTGGRNNGPYLDIASALPYSLIVNKLTASEFDFGTSTDFTLEFFYRSNDSVGYMFDSYNGGSTSRMYLYRDQGAAGRMYLVVYDGASGSSSIDETGHQITLDNTAWNHFAVTREGSSLRLFVNGALVGTITSATSVISGGDIILGNNTLSNASAVGDYSEFRIIKGHALYTSAFTPSSTPLTQYYTL